MAQVAFVANCVLSQNAETVGGAKRPAMWEPVIVRPGFVSARAVR